MISPWQRYRSGLLIHYPVGGRPVFTDGKCTFLTLVFIDDKWTLRMSPTNLITFQKLSPFYEGFSQYQNLTTHKTLKRSDRKRHDRKQLFGALKNTENEVSYGLKSNFSMPGHIFKFFHMAYRESSKIVKHTVKRFLLKGSAPHERWFPELLIEES